MKFTKEQAFEILRSTLTNGGKKTLRMSEKSINAQLDTLIPLVANDEMELADFVDKVKQTFITMNSNAEKDNSDFVKKWKEEHPDPTPDPDSQKSDKTDNPEIKALLDRLAALEAKDAAAAEAAAVADKRKELVAKMKEKGISDNEWVESFLSEVSITKDTDVEAKAESFLKIYNKTHAGGGNITPPQAGSGDPNKQDNFANVRDIMKNRRGIVEQETK